MIAPWPNLPYRGKISGFQIPVCWVGMLWTPLCHLSCFEGYIRSYLQLVQAAWRSEHKYSKILNSSLLAQQRPFEGSWSSWNFLNSNETHHQTTPNYMIMKSLDAKGNPKALLQLEVSLMFAIKAYSSCVTWPSECGTAGLSSRAAR